MASTSGHSTVPEFLDSEDERIYYQNRIKDKRRCFVPSCPNYKSPALGTVFVRVKECNKQDWCDKVGVKCIKRAIYCCQRHINLENDLENYASWKNKGVYPKLKVDAMLKSYAPDDQNEQVNDQLPSTSGSTCVVMVDSATQTQKHSCSIGISVKPLTNNVGTSFKARSLKNYSRSIRSDSNATVDNFSVKSSSNVTVESASASYVCSSDSTSAEMSKVVHHGREHLLKCIKNNPKSNIGLPKNLFWVIKLIADFYKIKELYIIITLFKIKNNDSFMRLSEEFQVAFSTIQKQFHINIIILASYFQNFIFVPSPLSIKINLPIVFRIRYANVQMLIDCLEIEIEKPTNPVKQAQTWSQYKSCNTLKYLVACTPSGFITFISKGYGGRISDKKIVLQSGFIDIVPTGAVIMADRGFKDIEADLAAKNVKLLRPPSVYTGQKLSKKEVITGKVIASLRVHVERVIRRLREFKICKPHSTINNKLVGKVDEIMIIVCGLANLQNPIIKES